MYRSRKGLKNMAANKSYFKMGEMYCYNEIKIIQSVTMGLYPLNGEGDILKGGHVG